MQCFCVLWLLYWNLDVVSQVLLATYFIDFITITANIHLTCPLVYLYLKSKYKLHLRFVLMSKHNAGGHPYFQFLASPFPALIKIYQRILTVGGNIVNYD